MIFQNVREIFGGFRPRQTGAGETDRNMTIFESRTPLAWGALDVPLLGIRRDWHGGELDRPAGFSLAMDRRRLWFIATHGRPAVLHPRSRPGKYLAGLWEYDVAELFIAAPGSDRYFEFNLSPNGAWWSCEFKSPRVREEEMDVVMPEVATHAELAPDGGWVAAMSVPLDLLRARLDFGPECRVNVAMILNHPEPRYLSAADLGGGTPDFHRPERFAKAAFAPLPPG